MKEKLSVTIDKKTIKLLEESIQEGLFRNKSHAVEYSITKTFKERKNDESI